MRFIWVYLGLYLALIAGAVVALWRGGVFPFLSPLSILVGLAVVVGLGVLLALVWPSRPA